eukprot:TRINITY_DN74711_c0_g1_i2.p1 TRINITY_DN74711_c0_g1~~TRINITY_DN74711_c0_g1_i2.p1  ORF type:complete len:393 (-),score=53.15 TRINITY_DN74711_c0_g1_i2:230-1408(-)
MFRFAISLLVAALPLLAQASGFPGVIFLDEQKDSYFRSDVEITANEAQTLSPASFAAATAALLGVSVPPSTDAEVSSQLNSLIVPDPFHRPRSMLMLVLPGADYGAFASNVSLRGLQVVQRRAFPSPSLDSNALLDAVDYEIAAMLKEATHEGLKLDVSDCSVLSDNSVAATPTGGNKVARPCDEKCKYLLTSSELVGEASEQLDQLLRSTFDISKDSDSKFLLDLACTVMFIRDGAENLNRAGASPHLFFSSLAGLQGGDSFVTGRVAFTLAVVSAHVNAIRSVNNCNMIAAIVLPGVLSEAPAHSHDLIYQTMLASRVQRPAARELRAVVAAAATQQTDNLKTPADVVSEAIIIATVIILLVALSLATGYLFNMPLTRDTLLYSGGPKMD